MLKNFTCTNMKYVAGFIAMSIAWLFPYAYGSAPDLMQQLFMVFLLCVASIMFGMRSSISMVFIFIFVGSLLMTSTSNLYWDRKIFGIIGITLGALGLHVGFNFQKRSEGMSWFLFAILIAASINAVEGLLQWFGLAGEFSGWIVDPERRGIAFGAFRQRNLFATFLCIGSICTVWLFHKRRLTESMTWFILIVLMFAVAASGSRTGLLEVIALAMLGVLWRKHQAPAVTRLLVGQSVILGIALFTLSKAASWLEFAFVSGFERSTRIGTDGRLIHLSNAIDLIKERPWFGWGWRETGYGHYVTLLSSYYGGLVDNVHNLPLQLAVEFGLPVSTTLVTAVIWSIWLNKPWRISVVEVNGLIEPASDRHFAWAILLLIVGIHSMLEYPLWYAGFLFLTGLAIGYVLPVQSHGKIAPGYGFWSKLLIKLIAMSLIILVLLAWQQYSKVLPIYKIPFTQDKEVNRKAMTTAIDNASGAWLFQAQLDFATLTLMDVTPQNAIEVRKISEKLLHYSAEPRVIQPLLLSLWYLNDVAALMFHAERFCNAFPIAFKRWSQEHSNHPMLIAAERAPDSCQPMIPIIELVPN